MTEGGLAAVSWRADATNGAQRRGADECSRGHSAAESENSGVVTFRCGGNEKLGNLHTTQPTFYGFSSSDARAGEFNTNVTSYVESRDQSGREHKSFAQRREGHSRGRADYGDAQQIETARYPGKKRVTGANSGRPDIPVTNAPQYEELLQCIKRQENEIAQQENEISQLRQACMSS